MTQPADNDPASEIDSLRREVVRLNKIVTSLMNRAERDMRSRDTDFGLFQATVTLENQVRERTRELEAALDENARINRALQREKEEQRKLIKKLEDAHVQLLQSEKLASIGQLAAGVAHEINNPIGFVNSNLGTLRKYVNELLSLIDMFNTTVAPLLESNPAIGQRLVDLHSDADFDFMRNDVLSLIEESINGTSRVRKIVQDLRNFSRTGEIEFEQADLHAGLDSTLNVVWNEIRFRADVVREYGELPLVECRPSQINQVFLNLLINASQAIPEQEHGSITIRSGCSDAEAWVSISDTGIGIPPEVVSRIFDPFFTTKPVGKGTGLGLSLSYGIIDGHGGRIEVDSQPGRGSTFTVWLPLKRQPDAATHN
ncbi:MAG: histidine kinase [Rhodocyclales bacterium]|nr:histidine kinase [Rhodocyclales bacterium]